MKPVDTSIRTFRQATGLAGSPENQNQLFPLPTLAEFSIDKGKHSP